MREMVGGKQKARVLVTDRTKLGTELLASAIQEAAPFDVHLSEYSERNFHKHLEALDPELVLISADLTGMYGPAAKMLTLAHEHSCSLRVIMLLQTDSSKQTADAIRSGAWMVLTAQQSVRDLVQCLMSAQASTAAELTEAGLR